MPASMIAPLVLLAVALAVPAHGTDVPIASKKLLVVDKLSVRSRAQVLYLAKDKAAGITKGAGTDVEAISARFVITYGGGGGSAFGAFTVPAGAAAGWKSNAAKVAKFANKGAPGGATQTGVALVRPGKMLKLLGKGAGDTPIDIVGAGAPSGDVFTSYCITNGSEQFCHCSRFADCKHKLAAGGTGAKLVCKNGTGDAACTAGSATTTTVTSTTPPTSVTTTTMAPLCVWGVEGDFAEGDDFAYPLIAGDVLFAWLSGPTNALALSVSGACAGTFCTYLVGDASQGSIDEATQRAQANDVSGLTPLECGSAMGSSQNLPTESSYVFVVTTP